MPSEEAGYFRRTDNFLSLDRRRLARKVCVGLHPHELAVSPPGEQAFPRELCSNRPLVEPDIE